MTEKTDEPVVILLSYWPLLVPDEGMQPGMPVDMNHMSNYLKSIPEIRSHCCLWMADEKTGTPSAVIIVDRAQEVADHLVDWADNEPAKWFSFNYVMVDDGYAFGLFPNIERSISRYEFGWAMNGHDPVNNPRYQIVFNPLTFGANTTGTFARMVPMFKSEITVGVLDLNDLPSDPAKVDQSKIHKLGVFQIKQDPQSVSWLNAYIDEMRGQPHD